MIGYSEGELRELHFTDITHPDHRETDVTGVERATRGEIPAYRAEKRYIRKDGRVVWAAVASSPVRDATGKVQYFLAMVEDITVAKEAAAALAESERKYRELANDLPTCVFEADLSGRLTYANRTGLDLFGFAEGEIVGNSTVEQRVIEPERERALRTFQVAVEKGEVPAGEYTALRRDGTTFPALISSRAVTRDGKAVGTRGILVDITERVEASRRIERALAGTIHALAVTTEMRDPYTAGHQERVTRLAVAIGRKLGLSGQALEGLRVAGTLHDVGKVSVPAEILSKPTELTPIEFGLVRSHPETGHAILHQIEFPWPVAEIVLQHHERSDGSGYPHGLRGDEILLEARILAVADSVEAMASHRPYRAALGLDAALGEVARGAGTTYDEDVVSACLSLFAEDGFRLDG
jgi:PAS domain S-box-containing protein/putative nucleotidyltransferase with HDIG domain